MTYEFDCENCGKHTKTRRAADRLPPRFCSMKCRIEGKRNEPPVFTREWLHQKYIADGMGCREIGALVDRDAKTILYWLRKYSIPTRPRGSDERQHFKKGSQNRLGIKHTEATKEKVGLASRQRGQVPYLKDGKHYLSGVRGSANPSWKGGITPERQTFYRSDEWKAACKTVWTRDNATCRRCGRRKVNGDKSSQFHIHHIVTFANKELRADPDNLVLLCGPCHYFVHSGANTNREFLGETLFDVSELEAQWPDMPDIEGGRDVFDQYPVAGGPEA